VLLKVADVWVGEIVVLQPACSPQIVELVLADLGAHPGDVEGPVLLLERLDDAAARGQRLGVQRVHRYDHHRLRGPRIGEDLLQRAP
jgi:hypothetical protein